MSQPMPPDSASPLSSSTNLAPSEQFVFFFRHCLRSIESTVYYTKKKQNQDPQSFVKNKLPDFNVPPEWCTEHGMDVMIQTGNWLGETYLKAYSGNVKIISDTAQRDVDTSLALIEGLAQAGVLTTTIQLDPTLFSPTKDNAFEPALCESTKKKIITSEIQQRLDTIPPPSLLEEALDLIDRYGRWKHKIKANQNITVKDTDLQGPVNLVKLYAQALFYSRASNITSSFMAKSSLEEMYQLVRWIYWTRSITKTGNSKAAQKGAVLASFLVDEQHEMPVQIVVGHDSTLNSLQTALGLEWTLTEYGGNSSPTPPGTALLFRRFTDNQAVVELLYPVFFQAKKAVLQNASTVMHKKNLLSDLSWQDLERRFIQHLSQYQGAMDCWNGAKHRPRVSSSHSSSYFTSTMQPVYIVGLVVLVGIMLLFLLRYKQSGERGKYERAPVSPELELT
jgi:hypothetical protein